MSKDFILTLNAGSSSIKFAVCSAHFYEKPWFLRGEISNFGPSATLSLNEGHGNGKRHRSIDIVDHRSGLTAILTLLNDNLPEASIVAVGHRIVHGGKVFGAPVLIDVPVLKTIESLVPLAPLHQPHNLAGIRAASTAFPEALQIACFDTAFHRNHPMVADMYGLPLQLHSEGIRRYGFHGLSYEYLAKQLAYVVPELAERRVVAAHLGNGASLCALHQGKSIASSMGFTALDGIPMGTRSGQIDPGVLLYLMTEKGMTAQEISDLLYKNAGLKGISGLSNDMRVLEAADAPEAALAIEYFVHRVRREIGALAAELGGLDAIVFSGGIGENSSSVRARVLDGLRFLGADYDPEANQKNSLWLSPVGTKTPAFVIRTDEEWMISQHVRALMSVPGR